LLRVKVEPLFGLRAAIVRLVGQVVRVSLETVKIVKSLPAKYAP
jgi:hypothetical protein